MRRRSDANSEAGPKGEGQEARSQEKCTKRKTPRRLRFQHMDVLKVRAWRRAVSTAHPCADETMADIVSATLRADPPPRAATQGPNGSGHPARGSKPAPDLVRGSSLTERFGCVIAARKVHE